MITSKAVINWMIERLAECHKKFPTGLPPAPRFIDSNGEGHPVFCISQVSGHEQKLIVGINEPPFTKDIPLSSVVLKKDRSALVLA